MRHSLITFIDKWLARLSPIETFGATKYFIKGINENVNQSSKIDISHQPLIFRL